jgi:hypothetical protein
MTFWLPWIALGAYLGTMALGFFFRRQFPDRKVPIRWVIIPLLINVWASSTLIPVAGSYLFRPSYRAGAMLPVAEALWQRIDDESIVWDRSTPRPAFGAIHQIYSDPHGRLWFLANDPRILMYDGTTWHHW